jgi:hypothetical protein
MFAMSGGLLSHALISTALLRELDASLDGRKCSTAGSDLRVGVSKQGPFFYPDVSVHCGDAELADDWKDTLLNPILIIEVLSPPSRPSTAARNSPPTAASRHSANTFWSPKPSPASRFTPKALPKPGLSLSSPALNPSARCRASASRFPWLPSIAAFLWKPRQVQPPPEPGILTPRTFRSPKLGPSTGGQPKEGAKSEC